MKSCSKRVIYTPQLHIDFISIGCSHYHWLSQDKRYDEASQYSSLKLDAHGINCKVYIVRVFSYSQLSWGQLFKINDIVS